MDPNLWNEYETTITRRSYSCKERSICMRNSDYQHKNHCALGDRFHSYAARVRHLELKQDPEEIRSGDLVYTHLSKSSNPSIPLKVDLTIVNAWLHCSQYHIIFPSLHSLSFLLDTWHLAPQYRQLVEQLYQRPLSSLSINLLPPVHFFSIELTQLLQHSPINLSNLRSLAVGCQTREAETFGKSRWGFFDFLDYLQRPATISIFEVTVISLSNLQRIDTCSTLSLKTLREIGAFPRLEWLSCHLPEETDYFLPPSSFSGLQGLSCCICHVSEATSLLDNISSAVLEEIDFIIATPSDLEDHFEEELVGVFARISHHHSRNSLERFSLRFADRLYSRFNPYSRLTSPSLYELVESLYNMPRLNTLILSIFQNAASKHRILQWCNSLPALSYIEFNVQPVLSLPVICILLQRQTHERVLPFILQVDEQLLEANHQRPLSHAVNWLPLRLGRSLEYHPVALARVLITLFPNLREVTMEERCTQIPKVMTKQIALLNNYLREYHVHREKMRRQDHPLLYWSKTLSSASGALSSLVREVGIRLSSEQEMRTTKLVSRRV